MNFRNFILIISLASFRLPILAQDYQDHTDFKHFPCPNSITGCYESFNNFHSGNPVLTSGFQMKNRYSNEIRDSKAGGYWLQFDKGVPPEISSNNHIWGVYYNDSLYINRKFFQGKSGFDKVYCLGSFGYFHGINPHAGAELDNSTVNSAHLFGVVGGIVTGGIGENRNYLYGKYPRVMIYLIDYKNGMISPLTRFKLEQILEDDQELLNLYSREEHKSSMMVMHAYLDTFAERHKYK